VKRFVFALALVLVAVTVSSCAVGEPQPPTYVSDTGVTLNGNVNSSVDGTTDYFWRLGETTAYTSETPHNSVEVTNRDPHPVSLPWSGLDADTTYHYQFCVQDLEEDPPREVCSKDQTFTTANDDFFGGDFGGFSGVGFTSGPHQISCPSPFDSLTDIYTTSDDGFGRNLISESFAAVDQSPTISPDGKRVAWIRSGDLYTDSAGGYLDPSADAELLATGVATPAWSPDGTKIAVVIFDGTDNEIAIVPAAGGEPDPITDNDTDDSAPAWSPDSEKIVFVAGRDGNRELYVMNADGSNQTRLTTTALHEDTPDWSPDRTRIAYTLNSDGFQVLIMPLLEGDAGGEPETVASGADPSWSPDGNWIAFQDLGEIFKTPLDPESRTNLTNNSCDDREPDWSPRPNPAP
jgi:TolB protein